MRHLRGKLYAIKGRSVSLPGGQSITTANSIFIDDTTKAIIDPSADRLTLREISRANTIDFCFLSHSHLDHLCSYDLFPDSTYYLHEDEQLVPNGFRGAVPSVIKKILRDLGLDKFQPHERFKDGDVFEIGSTPVCVVHAPGHTRGHSCFYFPNENTLYAADFDLSVVGPWYAQADSDIDDFINSAERLGSIKADIWVTGHWKWVVRDNIFNRLDRFIRKIEERDARLVSSVQESRSVKELSKLGLINPLLGFNRSAWLRASEEAMITKNLERLEARSRVRRVGREGWIGAGSEEQAGSQ